MAWRHRLDSVHHFLARRRFFLRLALKLRNQCGAVVAASLYDGIHPSESGEGWLLRCLSPVPQSFMDIGANRGQWLELMMQANPGAVGVCYEPAESLRDLLGSVVGRYPTVQLRSVAVADHIGAGSFRDLGADSQLSSLLEVAAADGTDGVIYGVETTTVDAEMLRTGFQTLDFLKIDTEGGDWAVLRSAGACLRSHRIRVVQFEYGANWATAGATLTHAAGWLATLGYRVFRLRRTSLEPLDLGRYGEHFSFSNCVALAPGVTVGSR